MSRVFLIYRYLFKIDNMASEYLIYIIKMGYDWKSRGIFQFIFTDDLGDDITGDMWHETPADGRPLPPNEEFISTVESLELDETFGVLEVIQDSEHFGMKDSIDGIIALAWEDINEDGDERLVFHYGESKESVVKKLFKRDLDLKKCK